MGTPQGSMDFIPTKAEMHSDWIITQVNILALYRAADFNQVSSRPGKASNLALKIKQRDKAVLKGSVVWPPPPQRERKKIRKKKTKWNMVCDFVIVVFDFVFAHPVLVLKGCFLKCLRQHVLRIMDSPPIHSTIMSDSLTFSRSTPCVLDWWNCSFSKVTIAGLLWQK